MEDCDSYLVYFDDYHEIDWHLEQIKRKTGERWYAREIAYGPTVGTTTGMYWGLFWKAGRKPNRKEIRSMLKELSFDSDCEYSEITF